MKRPFLILGFSYFAGLMFALFVGAGSVILLLPSLFFLTISCFFFKKSRKGFVLPIAFLTFLVAVIVYIFNFTAKVEVNRILADKKLEISGVVCELPTKQNKKNCYIVKTDSVKVLKSNIKKINLDKTKKENTDKINFEVNSKNISCVKFKVLSKEDLDVEAFDKIKLVVKTFHCEDIVGFSSGSREFSKGIDIVCFASRFDNIEIEDNFKKPFYFYFLKAKQNMSDAVKNFLPKKHAGVLNSFLFAKKDEIDSTVKTSFSNSGISHLLALSGTHMAIFSQLVLLFLSFLNFGKKARYLGSAVFIFLFMILTGFALSATRSGIMCIIYMLGMAFYKRADPLNSLGLSILIITFVNPFAVADIGLALSLFATLGIILFSKQIHEKLILIFSKINLQDLLTPKILKNIFNKITKNIYKKQHNLQKKIQKKLQEKVFLKILNILEKIFRKTTNISI